MCVCVTESMLEAVVCSVGFFTVSPSTCDCQYICVGVWQHVQSVDTATNTVSSCHVTAFFPLTRQALHARAEEGAGIVPEKYGYEMLQVALQQFSDSRDYLCIIIIFNY